MAVCVVSSEDGDVRVADRFNEFFVVCFNERLVVDASLDGLEVVEGGEFGEEVPVVLFEFG